MAGHGARATGKSSPKALGRGRWLVREEDLEKGPQIVLPFQYAQIVRLGVATVSTRDEGVAVLLDL